MKKSEAVYLTAARIFGEAAEVFARAGAAERAQICRQWRDAALSGAQWAHDMLAAGVYTVPPSPPPKPAAVVGHAH